MEQNQEFDKYANAKIEEPNLRLPESMLKVNTDGSSGKLCYMKIFEDDTRRAQHLAEAIAGGAKLDRKVHRIRNMELCKAIGENFEDMQQIHRVSKATIGLLVDSESDQHTHSFIDLVGTVEEVQMAEKLILDKILQTYNGLVFPVILMPPTIYGHEIRIHVNKVGRLVGDKNSNILAMEVVSGAWMQIDSQPPPGCPKWERVLSIYGPRTHVVKAVSLVHSAIFEPGESFEIEKDLESMFNELSFDEVMKGMKPRTRDIIEQFESSRKHMIEEAKHNKESSSSSGDQSEKEKQQELQVKEAVSSGSASGSCQAEEETQPQDEEDVEGFQDESKDKKQQNEEDVKKDQSEKEKQQELQVKEAASSGSTSGSCQAEEETQQQHVEDGEGSCDESKDRKQQNEEDVNEAQSEKEKQQQPLQVKGVASSGSCQADEEKQQQHEEDVEEAQFEKEKQQQQLQVKEAASSGLASGSCQAEEEK